MPDGTIQKLMSYYFNNDKFKDEIERAKNEFFDCAEGGTVITIDEKYMPFFIEWLSFDFRLQNGKGLIEDYYYRNPRKLPLYEIQVYKELISNVYGILEIQKVYIDEGMDVLMLNTGKKYYVHEHSATFQLKKGNIIFGRVSRVAGNYLLVGADSFMFDVSMDSGTKKHFIDKRLKLTPKDAVSFIKGEAGGEPEIDKDINIDELKKDFNCLLNEIGAGDLISADLVRKWLANINFKRKDTPIIDILLGLSTDWPRGSRMDRLIDLSAKLMNHSPQKALKGKTPQEMVKKGGFGSKGSNFSVKRIGGKWPDYANKGTKYMESFNIPKAIDEFKKAFKTLLKEETTGRFIFAVFANLGVCYLNYGMEFTARKLLNISLELNKNYKFAKKILAEMDTKEGASRLAVPLRSALKNARTKELKEFWKKAKDYDDAKLCKAYYDISLSDHEAEWERDPAKKYYDYLKTLEINFNKVKK